MIAVVARCRCFGVLAEKRRLAEEEDFGADRSSSVVVVTLFVSVMRSGEARYPTTNQPSSSVCPSFRRSASQIICRWKRARGGGALLIAPACNFGHLTLTFFASCFPSVCSRSGVAYTCTIPVCFLSTFAN